MQKNKFNRLYVTVAGLFFMLGCVYLVPAWAREQISMFQGEVSVLDIGKVERVAIGNPHVASNTILTNGQLILLADKVGATTVHIWLANGSEQDFDIMVRAKKNMDSFKELASLLKKIPGVHLARHGSMAVTRGTVSPQDQTTFSKIIARYGDTILDLTKPLAASESIKQLLAGVPNIAVKDIDGRPIVTGEISSDSAKIVKTVHGLYPDMVDLTQVKSAIAGKMVYMKVRIMEMGKSLTDKLGVQWSIVKDGAIGPSAEFGVEGGLNGASIINSKSISGALTAVTANADPLSSLTHARGYFGIATGITSMLNLSEISGDAVTLAEPRLSTRSGGKAEFLAGGEVPMPVTSAQGQSNVQFKKYGIILNIEPTVDEHGNILAHVDTEISSVDDSVAVGGIPGMKSRKTSTDISIRPGETLVIAGLLSEKVSKDLDKVKWLGDIPILGALFRSRGFINNRTELVIFVTPFIYDANSPVNRENLIKLDEMNMRFNELSNSNLLLD